MLKITDDTSAAAITAEIERDIARELGFGVNGSSPKWARHLIVTRLLRACEACIVDDVLEDREQWPPRLARVRQLRDMQAAEYDKAMRQSGIRL